MRRGIANFWSGQLVEVVEVVQSVWGLLATACYNCHSTQTVVLFASTLSSYHSVTYLITRALCVWLPCIWFLHIISQFRWHSKLFRELSEFLVSSSEDFLGLLNSLLESLRGFLGFDCQCIWAAIRSCHSVWTSDSEEFEAIQFESQQLTLAWICSSSACSSSVGSSVSNQASSSTVVSSFSTSPSISLLLTCCSGDA